MLSNRNRVILVDRIINPPPLIWKVRSISRIRRNINGIPTMTMSRRQLRF